MKRTRCTNKVLITGYVGQSLDFRTVQTDNGDSLVGNFFWAFPMMASLRILTLNGKVMPSRFGEGLLKCVSD